MAGQWVNRLDNQANLGWVALLQRLEEGASCSRRSPPPPANLGMLSCLVLGTSLHPPANWALGQAPISSIQPFNQ